MGSGYVLAPALVAELSDVRDFVAGSTSSCARLADGSVHCMGQNDLSQLANGTTVPSATPVPVSLAEAAVEIVSGWEGHAARLASGEVRAWGYNGAGTWPTPTDPIITEPAYPDRLSGQGWWEIRGLAWSGRGKIARVDVSADGGRTWHAATLDEPVLPKCHTRFRFAWNWAGGEATLMSRATDETGYVQPTLEALMAARGPATA